MPKYSSYATEAICFRGFNVHTGDLTSFMPYVEHGELFSLCIFLIIVPPRIKFELYYTPICKLLSIRKLFY